MMEAARTSETLVNFYQTTRCYDPEDNHLRTHPRENLKSYEVPSDKYIWTKKRFCEEEIHNSTEESLRSKCIAQLIKKSTRLLWNLKVLYRVQRSPQLVPTLSWFC
jgi:hypothetical protein